MIRAARALCLALLAAVLLAPAARAADWDAEGFIAPAGAGGDQLLAHVDPNSGEALFAWKSNPTGTTIDYRTRARNGPFGPISSLPFNNLNVPEFASSRGGRAILVWPDQQPETFNYRYLRVSLREPGGAFSEPQTLFDTGDGETLCRLLPAVTEAGDVVVVFGTARRTGPGQAEPDCRYFMTVRPAGASAFTAPVPLADEQIDFPSIAFDDAGNGIVAWRGPTTTDVRVRRYSPGGALSAVEGVGVAGETVPRTGGRLVLEVSGESGRAILGFPAQPSGRDYVHVAAAIGTTTSPFGVARVLSGPASLTSGQLGPFFDGDAGDNGSLGLTWRSGTRGSRVRIQAAVAGPRDTELVSADTQRLSGYGVQTPRIAVADNGLTTVIWLTNTGDGNRVLDAAVGDDREFRPRQRISEGARVAPRPQPVVELNERDEAFAVWAEATVTPTRVHAAKQSKTTGRFSRALDVLRARRGENVSQFLVLPGRGGSMFVAAQRGRSSGPVWDLRSYAER